MALLEWRYERDGTVLDRVRLDADGGITRLLTHPGAGPAPELGWWSGTFDAGPLAAARQLAERDWSEGPTQVPPAAAGRWLASRDDGAVLPLDAAAGDDLTAQLSAVRGAVLDAATSPVQVARLTGRVRAIGDEHLPLLDVASVGSDAVSVVVAADVAGTEAAFLNDDAETLAFLGDVLVLEPGTHAFALLRTATPDGRLAVHGEVAGGEILGAGASVAISLQPEGEGSVAFTATVEVVADGD